MVVDTIVAVIAAIPTVVVAATMAAEGAPTVAAVTLAAAYTLAAVGIETIYIVYAAAAP
jgi:hypothetical protein